MEEDKLDIKTPLWSFQASGKTVLTALAVIVVVGSVIVHHYADAAYNDKRDEADAAYRKEVVSYLKGIMWVQMQPDKKREQIADQMEVPEAVQRQIKILKQ